MCVCVCVCGDVGVSGWVGGYVSGWMWVWVYVCLCMCMKEREREGGREREREGEGEERDGEEGGGRREGMKQNVQSCIYHNYAKN